MQKQKGNIEVREEKEVTPTPGPEVTVLHKLLS